MIMTDQQSNDQPAESDGVSNAVAAADSTGPEDSTGASSQTAALLAATGAAKPRVFKMSDEFLMFKFKVCFTGSMENDAI